MATKIDRTFGRSLCSQQLSVCKWIWILIEKQHVIHLTLEWIQLYALLASFSLFVFVLHRCTVTMCMERASRSIHDQNHLRSLLLKVHDKKQIFCGYEKKASVGSLHSIIIYLCIILIILYLDIVFSFILFDSLSPSRHTISNRNLSLRKFDEMFLIIFCPFVPAFLLNKYKSIKKRIHCSI